MERCCEYCFRCDQPTGRAGRGEDSLYIHDFGPFCGECFVAGEKLSEGISELTRLTAEIAAKEARIAELDSLIDKALTAWCEMTLKCDELRSALAASKAREGEAVEVIKRCRQLNSEEKTWTEGAKGHEAMTVADKFLTRLKERQ